MTDQLQGLSPDRWHDRPVGQEAGARAYRAAGLFDGLVCERWLYAVRRLLYLTLVTQAEKRMFNLRKSLQGVPSLVTSSSSSFGARAGCGA